MSKSIGLNDPSGLSDLPLGRMHQTFRPLADEYATAAGTNAHGVDNESRINGGRDKGAEVGAGDPEETLTEDAYGGWGTPDVALVPPDPIAVFVVPQPVKTVRHRTIINTLISELLIGVDTSVLRVVALRSKVTIPQDRTRKLLRLYVSIMNNNVEAWQYAVSTDPEFASFLVMGTSSGIAPFFDFEGGGILYVAPYVIANQGAGVNNVSRLNSVWYSEDVPLDHDAR